MPYTTRFPWKEERKIIGNPELWRFITHYCHILLNDTHQPFLGSVSFFVLTRTTLWQMVFCGISMWWWPKILGRELYSSVHYYTLEVYKYWLMMNVHTQKKAHSGYSQTFPSDEVKLREDLLSASKWRIYLHWNNFDKRRHCWPHSPLKTVHPIACILQKKFWLEQNWVKISIPLPAFQQTGRLRGKVVLSSWSLLT